VSGQPRPGTVTAASGLLYLLALVGLVNVALAIYSASLMDTAKIKAIYEEAGMPAAQAETMANGAAIGVYAASAIPLLIGVLCLILAIFVGKGKQWARITTWVVAGVAVCCNGVGLAGTAAGGMLSGMGNTSTFDQESAMKDIEALSPAWLNTTSTALTVVILVASVLVIILLLLPPSNQYFRKPEPQWTPPPYPAP
jgi:hypothetical protein